MLLRPPDMRQDQWTWRIVYWGKTLAQGACESQKEAQTQLSAKTAEVMLSIGKKKANKGAFRLTLNSYLPRRPYVVAWVLLNLAEEDAMDRSKELCVKGAELEERRLFNETGAKMRTPLPSHPMAKPAHELAAKLWDGFTQFGYVGKKADAEGRRLFGYWWIDHACEEMMVEILNDDGESDWEPMRMRKVK